MTATTEVKPESAHWLGVLSSHRVAVIGGHEVVRGTLHAGLDESSPAVQEALGTWRGSVSVARAGDRVDVVLVRPLTPPPRPRWWLHAALFLATSFTTTTAGAILSGIDPLRTRVVGGGNVWLPVPTGLDTGALVSGLPFSLCFLGILLVHEMGHYVAASWHRVRASLPYFVPFPAYFSIVGTLGAFIRLRGPIVRRSILFDVGAAGPLASFVASIPVVVVGMALSETVSGHANGVTPFVIEFFGEPLWIGTGVLFRVVAVAFFGGSVGLEPVLLHPVALAGWLGLFVTSLNLMPVGQLDGGHVLYSLHNGLQRHAGRLFLVALAPLGLLWWGWWMWGGAIVLLSRGRVAHPRVVQEQVPLNRGRRLLALATILVFFLTFTPLPLAL